MSEASTVGDRKLSQENLTLPELTEEWAVRRQILQ